MKPPYKSKMVLYFEDQDGFDQLTDVEKFLSWAQTQNLSHQSNDEIQNLRCHICNHIPTLVYSNTAHHRYHFALRLSCGVCQTFWNVCKYCSSDNQPTNFVRYSRRQLVNGRRLSIDNVRTLLDCSMESHLCTHSSNSVLDDESNGLEDHNDTTSDPSTTNNDRTTRIESIVLAIISSMFQGTEMTLFDMKLKEALLERETKKQYADFLIKKYWLKNIDCSLKAEEVILFLRHLRFIMQLSRDDNKELSYIVSSLRDNKLAQYQEMFESLNKEKRKVQIAYEAMKGFQRLLGSNGIVNNTNFELLFQSLDANAVSESNSDFVELRLPTSISQIRQILEADHSLLNNILIPPITLHDGGMSYVSPSNVLRLAICNGVPFEVVSGRNYSEQSLHKRSVYRAPVFKNMISGSNVGDDVITILYGFWSDGCYCGTESKGRRNQAKMGTIHIAHHTVTERHVFPVMFGRKQDDEEEVRKLIIEDMVKLSKTTVACYIPVLKQVRRVRFLLGYAILDRIEHAEITCYLGPTGKFSRQLSFSCPIFTQQGNVEVPYSLCKALTSCWSCWNKRVEFMRRGLYREAQRSRRCRDCYDWDLNSVEFYQHPNFPIDSITPTDISTFHQDALKSKQITFETMKLACLEIFDQVKRGQWTQATTEHYARRECIRESVWKKVWKQAKDASRDHNGDIEDIEFDVSCLPAFWNQDLISLNGFHLGVMHYLFLNIGKHLMEIVNMKMSESGLWTDTYNMWNSHFLSVRKMSLSWCKAWSLGSTALPGSMWVSENFVGFSIICKYIGSTLLTMERTRQHHDNLVQLFETYYVLCAVIMSPDEPNERHCKYAVCLSKCFLSLVDEYCSTIQRQKINKIESTSCFINLLSVGDRMKEYGVMRNYWEGGYRGEGIFRSLKGLVSRGLYSPKVTLQIMKKQYKNLAINDLISMKLKEADYVSLLQYELQDRANDIPIENNEEPTDENLLQDNPDRYRRFYCYSNLQELEEKIRNKEALAATYHKNSSVMYTFIGARKRTKTLCALYLNAWSTLRETHVCSVSSTGNLVELQDVSDRSTDYMSCLMLPIYHLNQDNEEDDIQMKYFIVNEDHKEMISDLSFHMPKLHLQERMNPNLNGVNGHQNDQDIQEAATICTDRNRCMEFVGRNVQAFDTFPIGKVTSFRYLRSIVSIDTAMWTVKYYTTVDCTGNARKQVALDYYELKNRLIS